MDIAQISQTLREDAVAVVFVNVLMQQMGLPVPAVPTLLLAGGLATASGNLGKVFAVAIIASVIADWIWYLSGKLFGYRVLAGLCKLSINPASCVSQPWLSGQDQGCTLISFRSSAVIPQSPYKNQSSPRSSAGC